MATAKDEQINSQKSLMLDASEAQIFRDLDSKRYSIRKNIKDENIQLSFSIYALVLHSFYRMLNVQIVCILTTRC